MGHYVYGVTYVYCCIQDTRYEREAKYVSDAKPTHMDFTKQLYDLIRSNHLPEIMDPYLKRIEKILGDMDSYMEEVLGYRISTGEYPHLAIFLKKDRNYSDYVTCMEKKRLSDPMLWTFTQKFKVMIFFHHVDYW